jgi:molybdate transport system ATP-binding protein
LIAVQRDDSLHWCSGRLACAAEVQRTGSVARRVAINATGRGSAPLCNLMKDISKLSDPQIQSVSAGSAADRWHIGCINESNRRFRLLQVRPYQANGNAAGNSAHLTPPAVSAECRQRFFFDGATGWSPALSVPGANVLEWRSSPKDLPGMPRFRLPSARSSARYIRVDLENVSLSLGGRAVLRGIDWQIRPGQRWVLIGPNGAGKTQLLKLLAGDVWPSPLGAHLRCYAYRGESFNDPYGIKQEIAYLGAERQDRYEHYQWNHRVEVVVGTGLHRTDIALEPLSSQERMRIGQLLRRLRIEALARRRFLTLSYGERRLVLLARALAWAPKLLLLDELFNGLDGRNRERVQHCLGALSRSSLPWVLTSHRSEDIPQAATHLCRLEGGRITLAAPLDARARRAALAGTGAARGTGTGRPRNQSARARARVHLAAAHGPGDADVLIALRRVSVWREGAAVLRRVSLQIRRGECWVVHGANGSGKSSFMQLLHGDLSPASGGSITRAGIASGVPLALFKRQVGLVTAELQLLQPRYLSVEEVVASGLHASVGLEARLSDAQRLRARRALRRVGAAALAARTIRELSYGQLRRVLFARALVHEPAMLLLDEPHAGVDARTRARLRSLVQQAFESGVTVVISTHHRDEWPRGATHELELAQSRVVYCGPLRAARAGRPVSRT